MDFHVIAQVDDACEWPCECEFSFDMNIYEMDDAGHINCPMGAIRKYMDLIVQYKQSRLELQWGVPPSQPSPENAIYGAQEDIRHMLLQFRNNPNITQVTDHIFDQFKDVDLLLRGTKLSLGRSFNKFPGNEKYVFELLRAQVVVSIFQSLQNVPVKLGNPISQFISIDKEFITHSNPTGNETELSLIMKFCQVFLAVAAEQKHRDYENEIQQAIPLSPSLERPTLFENYPLVLSVAEKALASHVTYISHLALAFHLLLTLDVQVSAIYQSYSSEIMPTPCDDILARCAFQRLGITDEANVYRAMQEWRNQVFSISLGKTYVPAHGRFPIAHLHKELDFVEDTYSPIIHIGPKRFDSAAQTLLEEYFRVRDIGNDITAISTYLDAVYGVQSLLRLGEISRGLSPFTGKAHLTNRFESRPISRSSMVILEEKYPQLYSLLNVPTTPGHDCSRFPMRPMHEVTYVRMIQMPCAMDVVLFSEQQGQKFYTR